MDSYGKIYPLSNPWIITTSVFAICGWLIAFVGACAAAIHGVAWWIIIFELFFTVGIIVALGLGGFGPHRGMLLTLLAISFVYLTYAIPLIRTDGANGARATVGGLIIMIIMQGFWILLLGSSEESRLYRLFYRGIGSGSGGSGGGGGVNLSSINRSSFQRNFYPHGDQQQQQQHHRQHQHSKESALPPLSDSSVSDQDSTTESYPTAKALHTYRANPQDPSELSFSKDEELEIIDRKGNWWQARKQDGSIGIVPSNYFASF